MMKKLKKNRTLQYCVTVILPLCLTGCMGIYEGGFECSAGAGVGCKSISEVNDMVNLGELPKQSPNHLIQARPEIWYAPRSVQKSIPSIQEPLLQAKVVLPIKGAQ